MKKAITLATAILLFGCDDSNSDSNSNQNTDEFKAAESAIAGLVSDTNSPTNAWLLENGTYNFFSQTGTVRFDTTSQIPLYYVSSSGSDAPTSIKTAYSNLEARLGDIFTDITPVAADLSVYRDTSYTNENRGNNTFDADSFNSAHGISYGIIISEGTAYYSSEYSDDPQNMCGNASTGPYTGSLSVDIDSNTHQYASDTVLWVNMGNNQCSWGYEMVMHETAHNLGMFDHLDDDYFGLWSSTAMNVLATLYANPAGTPYSDLVIDYQ